jgi:hypothetical protein
VIVLRPPIEWPHARIRIAWLTGLSDPQRCRLSEAQETFLRRLDAPEACKLYRNFPYLPCEGEAPPPRLLRASLRDGRQFLAASGWRSKTAASYRSAAVAHWQALARSTDRLLILVGSCGLEIVRRCLACPAGSIADVRVAALGPVGWARPPCEALLVQGSRDYISRLFFRRPDVLVPSVGHMDYLSSDRVFDAVNRWICDNTSN